MRKLLRTALLVALGLTIQPTAHAAPAVPLPPATVWGRLTVDGAPAVDGTFVRANIAGLEYGATTTTTQGGIAGAYVLDVRADDPFTPEVEGGRAGETVTFASDGLIVGQTVTWNSGAVYHLELAARRPLSVTAQFGCTPQDGDPPLVVVCTDTSTGDVDTWRWDFGDGSSSTARHPGHTYTQQGTYTVTLTASGLGGSDTHLCRACVEVGADGQTSITPLFTCTPRQGPPPLTVTCTDQSKGNVDAWHWDFGDGGTSAARNPTHTYTQQGAYTVTLTISGAHSRDSLASPDYVLVQQPPVARFAATPRTGIGALTVRFQDQSEGAVHAWSWQFGDNTTSSERNPIHHFGPGTYTVTLTVAGPGGLSEFPCPSCVAVQHGLYFPQLGK